MGEHIEQENKFKKTAFTEGQTPTESRIHSNKNRKLTEMEKKKERYDKQNNNLINICHTSYHPLMSDLCKKCPWGLILSNSLTLMCHELLNLSCNGRRKIHIHHFQCGKTYTYFIKSK